MLSKGIIYLGRGELVVPAAQEVYVAALKMKTVRACYATLHSLDVNHGPWGSQFRLSWYFRKFTAAAQWKTS